MRVSIIFLFLLLLSGGIIAQQNKSTIKGVVRDSDGKYLSFATVVLLNSADSVISEFSVTNNSGEFTLSNVKFGNYLLQCSFLGYRNVSRVLPVNKSEISENIVMQKQNTDLSGVDIEAEHVPVKIKEDTVEYNSAAFITQPNANVEQLLKRLPGVEVSKDGTVTAQGEQVTKVMVDGKEFFGDDPKLATKNLPADAVEKIQVFDKKSDMSEFTGIDDGQTTKTINLVLKEGKKSGYFGNAMAGFGLPDDSYEAKLNVNRFTKATQLSVLAMSNNINDQGFSFEDYVNFMGGFRSLMESGLGSFQNGSPTAGLNSSLNSGLTESLAGGINFNFDISKRTEFKSSYFYNNIQSRIESSSTRMYFNNSADYLTASNNEQDADVSNHRFNFKADHEFNKKSDLKLKGRLGYNEGISSLLQTQQSTDENGVVQNSTRSVNIGSGNSYDIDADLTYRLKLNRPGRSLVVGLRTVAGKKDLNSDLDAIDNISSTSDTAQLQEYDHDQFSYVAEISYVEPLGKGRYIELSYEHNERTTSQQKNFFNIDPTDDSQTLDEKLSNTYDNTYRYDNAGINYRVSREKYNTTIGIYAQQSELDGQLSGTDGSIQKSFSNLLPNLRFNYNFSNRKRLRMNYDTNVNEPSIEQLQPVVDNSNPLQIYIGNADLKAEYAHSINLRYMAFNQFSFSSFFTTIRGTYTTNKIATQFTVDSNFIQTSQPVNVDHDISLRAYMSYDAPIKPLRIKFMVKPAVSYNRSILFINGIETNSDRTTTELNVNIGNRKKEVFDITLGSKYVYSLTQYSSASSQDQQFLTSNYYCDFTVSFLKDWNFESSFDYTFYSGSAFDNEEAIPLLQASISRLLFKSKKGQLKFRIFDILDQNTGFSRNTNLNFIEEVRSNNIGRYYMVSFVYALSGFEKKGEGGWWSRFGGKRS